MWIERVEETTEANRVAAESAGTGRGWARAALVRGAQQSHGSRGLADLAELLAGPSGVLASASAAQAASCERATASDSLLERAAERIGEVLAADEVAILRAPTVAESGRSLDGDALVLAASWTRAGRAVPTPRGSRIGARLVVPCRAGGELFAVLRVDGSRLGSYGDPDAADQARVAATLIAAHLERERRAAEIAELRSSQARSERLALVGRVASSAAHDFNNVLTAILGYADLLELETAGALAGRGATELEEIRAATQRGAVLVEELLVLGRGRAQHETHAAPLDLADVVARLAGMARRLAGDRIRVELETEADLPRVRVDRESLERVILNLVANARHAIEARRDGTGRITISLGRGRAGSGRPGASAGCATSGAQHAPGGARAELASLRLSVRDDGCGMDEAVKQRLFEPFFTTRSHAGGTGLGLAGAADFVRRAGGRIEVESSPGQGTALHLDFPIDPA